MKRFLGLAVALLLLAGLASFPVSIRQGVNYQVHEIRMPLGVKISEFLIRDYWYRRMAREITEGAAGPRERLEKILVWTRGNIRSAPPGWPVMDDHIHHTIIRGYGVEEQVADVFTNLSSYAGVRSFWGAVRPPGEPGRFLSFCCLEGRWTVWDAAKGEPFLNPDGSLASVEELSKEPGMAPLAHFFVPKFTRPEKQMPGPRVLFEAQRSWMRLANKEEEFDPEVVFTD